MVLKDILSISGEAGLFRFVAQGKNSVIVEHLETGKRSTAFASAKVSSLEDISIFTMEGDIALGKLFDSIFEKQSGAAATVAVNDNKALRAYFGEILPDYDKERVYVSDMKKVILWYNLLHKLNLLVKDEKASEEETTVEAEKVEKTEKVKKVAATSKSVKESAPKRAPSTPKRAQPGRKKT